MALSNYVERQATESLSVIDFTPTQTEQKPLEDVYVSDLPLKKPVQDVFLKPVRDIPTKTSYTPQTSERPYKESQQTQQQSFIKHTEIQEIETEEKIIGQYAKTYILIEKEDGLEIVDQHIADERYIYEKLKTQKEIASQILFISDVIEVTPTEAQLIRDNKDKFEHFGFEIEVLNDKEVTFKKVPQLLSRVNTKEILSDILENLDGDIAGLEEHILITTSCKAAVKAHQELSLFQMQELIKKWRKCEKPYTCPHGRPISKLIPHKQIAGFFERNK